MVRGGGGSGTLALKAYTYTSIQLGLLCELVGSHRVRLGVECVRSGILGYTMAPQRRLRGKQPPPQTAWWLDPAFKSCDAPPGKNSIYLVTFAMQRVHYTASGHPVTRHMELVAFETFL